MREKGRIKLYAADATPALCIYGTIGERSSFGDFFGFIDNTVGVAQVREFLEANKDAAEIEVRINSRGGEVTEGFAIHDLLINSGKKVTTIIEGRCASIATVIFLAGSVRKMHKHSDFMIHNPWLDPFCLGPMEAEDLRNLAEYMEKEEERLLNFYVTKTGTDKELIRSWMKKETTFHSAEALELKFVTEVIRSESKVEQLAKANAFALIKKDFTKNQTMSKTTKPADAKAADELANGVKDSANILNAIKKILGVKSKAEVAAKEVTLKDGTTKLTIETDGEPKDGDKVTNADGTETADGSYELEDGTTIEVAAGVITKVTKPEEPNEEVENLKAELKAANEKATALEDEVKALKANAEGVTPMLNELNEKLTKLQALSSTFKPQASAQTFATEKKDDEANAFAEARKRRAEERASKK